MVTTPVTTKLTTMPPVASPDARSKGRPQTGHSWRIRKAVSNIRPRRHLGQRSSKPASSARAIRIVPLIIGNLPTSSCTSRIA
jgi:hypothetical protein